MSRPLPSNWNTRRHKAKERDGHQCQHCGSTKNLEVHHIVPRRHGGNDRLSNLQTLCRKCHLAVDGKAAANASALTTSQTKVDSSKSNLSEGEVALIAVGLLVGAIGLMLIFWKPILLIGLAALLVCLFILRTVGEPVIDALLEKKHEKQRKQWKKVPRVEDGEIVWDYPTESGIPKDE